MPFLKSCVMKAFFIAFSPMFRDLEILAISCIVG